jgi:hypothetical protein
MVFIVQHKDCTSEHAGMLSLDGVLKVLEGSILVLFSDGSIRVHEYSHQQPGDVEETA